MLTGLKKKHGGLRCQKSASTCDGPKRCNRPDGHASDHKAACPNDRCPRGGKHYGKLEAKE